jgi:hypothetical protein
MLWNHSDFFFIAAQLKIYQKNKEYIFCTNFIKMYTECNEHHFVIIQNVKKRGIFSIERNYGAFNRDTLVCFLRNILHKLFYFSMEAYIVHLAKGIRIFGQGYALEP